MSKNNWKKRLNVVYSTNPDFGYQEEVESETATLKPQMQKLRVQIDKKNRGGKVVTLITGFVGSDEDLNKLGKTLKSKCGVGGSAKNNEIIVQGDFKSRVVEILIDLGYSQTKSKG